MRSAGPRLVWLPRGNAVGYFGRRLGHAAIILLAGLVVVFVITYTIGDPARLMLPPEAPRSAYLALRAKLGLDEPITTQFADVLGRWIRGDFGVSIYQERPALPLALERLPATLLLVAAAAVIAFPTAVVFGALAAVKSNGRLDRGVALASVAAVSTPEIWSGLLLILLVAVQFDLLPTSGTGGIEYLILPALTLAIRPWGRIAPITRAAVDVELRREYTLAGQAKGFGGVTVLRRALRNALIPIITIAGLELAQLFQAAVIVEFIFDWPGFANLFITAVGQRDLPVIQACAFLMAVIVVGINIAVDCWYFALDPRVRVE